MNNIVLVGYLKNKIFKEIRDDLCVCEIIIQMNDDEFKIELWNDNARKVNDEFFDDSLVAVRGHLKARNFENENGDKIYKFSIIADKISLIGASND